MVIPGAIGVQSQSEMLRKAGLVHSHVAGALCGGVGEGGGRLFDAPLSLR